MIKIAICIMALSSILISGCQSTVVSPDNKIIVFGRYNDIGACLYKIVEDRGYTKSEIKYTERSAVGRADLDILIRNLLGIEQGTLMSWSLRQIDDSHVDARLQAQASIGEKWAAFAIASLSACSGPAI